MNALTAPEARAVEVNQHVAVERSRFEQVLFRLKNYVNEQKLTVPECFISYAWGVPDHEHWVEHQMTSDLRKAGVTVVLDRWDNPPGSCIGRFVDRFEKVSRIVVIGTAAYHKKYDNEDPDSGTVVAAECAQINTRMRGAEKRKATLIPALLEGKPPEFFPPCLHDQVYCDFRKSEAYFTTMLDLLLSLFAIKSQESVAVDLRAFLAGQRL